MISDLIGIWRIQRPVAVRAEKIDLVHIKIGFLDGIHHFRPFRRLIDINHLRQNAIVVLDLFFDSIQVLRGELDIALNERCLHQIFATHGVVIADKAQGSGRDDDQTDAL